MSLTVLRTSAAKVNCKLKYYKVLGGLDESSHKIYFHDLSVFVRIRACIHINLWPEWVFWVFSMVVSSCGTLSQVSVPSSAPVEGKAMESQNLRCQGTMLECSHLFLYLQARQRHKNCVDECEKTQRAARVNGVINVCLCSEAVEVVICPPLTNWRDTRAQPLVMNSVKQSDSMD